MESTTLLERASFPPARGNLRFPTSLHRHRLSSRAAASLLHQPPSHVAILLPPRRTTPKRSDLAVGALLLSAAAFPRLVELRGALSWAELRWAVMGADNGVPNSGVVVGLRQRSAELRNM
ncbi:hypothetical protein Droror1_Dr00020747 [Drosera rotundifolia]